MTEADWLTCTDPGAMLAALRGRASPRKLRLFALACCRRTRTPVRGKETRRLVELAERFADGEDVGQELAVARGQWLGRLDMMFGV